MAIFRNTETNISKVDRLLYLANSSYFLGIGKDTVWDNSWGTEVTEENPPYPKPQTTQIPDIKLYKRPYFQTLATESDCGDIEFGSCGESLGDKKVTLINLETTPREVLEVINPEYLYFRVIIEDVDLEFANLESFRVAGLFKDITFNPTGQIRYLPSAIALPGRLYWASYFTSLQRNRSINKSSIFEILLKL